MKAYPFHGPGKPMKICQKVKEVELNKLFISMKALLALQNIHTKFEQNPWWTVEIRHRIVDEKGYE